MIGFVGLGLMGEGLTRRLIEKGHAVTPAVLDPAECDELSGLFDNGRFRSTIDMARHRFGEGTYRYFSYPQPSIVEELRRM